jgi:hypothetical protein
MRRRERQPEQRTPAFEIYDPQTEKSEWTDTPPLPGAAAAGTPAPGAGQPGYEAARPPVEVPCLIVPHMELTGIMGPPDKDGHYNMTEGRYALNRERIPEFCRPPSKFAEQGKGRKGGFVPPVREYVVVPNEKIYRENILGGQAVLRPITDEELAQEKLKIEERKQRQAAREAERRQAALQQTVRQRHGNASGLAVRSPNGAGGDNVSRFLSIMETLAFGQGPEQQSDLFEDDHTPSALPPPRNAGNRRPTDYDGIDLYGDERPPRGRGSKPSGRPGRQGKESRNTGKPPKQSGDQKKWWQNKYVAGGVGIASVLLYIATGSHDDPGSNEAAASISGAQKDAAKEAAREKLFVYDGTQTSKLKVGGMAVKATMQLGVRYSGLNGQPYGWVPNQALDDSKSAPYVATTDQYIMFAANASNPQAVTSERVENAADNTSALTIHLDKIGVGPYLDAKHQNLQVRGKSIKVADIPAARAEWQRTVDATPSSPTVGQAQAQSTAKALLESTPTAEQATALNKFITSPTKSTAVNPQFYNVASGVVFAAELKSIEADKEAQNEVTDMVVDAMETNLKAQNDALNKINHTANKITFTDPEGQLASEYVLYLASKGMKESSNQAGVLEYKTTKNAPVSVRVYDPAKQLTISKIK